MPPDDHWRPAPPDPPGEDEQTQDGELGEDGAEQIQTLYPDLDRWVTEYLAGTIRRRFGGSLTWCPWWSRHAEAVSRLNSMWQEWESARRENTMSAWWLTHADPHLAVLMNPNAGPFMGCKPAEGTNPGRHADLPALQISASEPPLWYASAFSDADRAPEADPAPDPAPDPA